MQAGKMTMGLLAGLVVMLFQGVALGAWSEPVAVPIASTADAEWDPFLSYDGLSLYFSKGKTPTWYYHRMYVATREVPYGPFTSLTEISELNASGCHIQCPWVSPDNLRLYYMRTESPGYWRLKFSERASVDDPWPVGANISELNALGDVIYDPTLTSNELVILFADYEGYEIPGGEGGGDIWMATRPDRYSPFGNVTNAIGINTAAKESGPSISPDGLTVVFYSDRNGQAQLFRATRASLAEPFANVEHLSGCDTAEGSVQPCLTSDGSAIYFRRGGNQGDIYVSYWDASLVAHWKFDEGEGSIAYDSADSHDGTLINGPDWTTGVLDGALSFDGFDDYVAVPDDAGLNITGDLTISAWVNFAEGGTLEEGSEKAIVTKCVGNGTTNNPFDFRTNNAVDELMLRLVRADAAGHECVYSTQGIPLNSWHHVLVRIEDKVCDFYVDGALTSKTGSFTKTPTGNTQPLLIGRRDDGLYLGGIIDDVQIYDRALSAGEVEQLYAEGGPPPPTVFYVDGINGSDLNDGLTLETAFATIQKGIDTAQDGEMVMVYPAVYGEAIDYKGKAITVQGVATAAGGPVLEAPGDYAVSFYTGEEPNSVLKSLVIRNSFDAVFIAAASPTLTNLTIVDNEFGIAAYAGADPCISNCIFSNNMDGDLFGCEAQHSFSQQGMGPVEEGLVAYWKFDEGAGTTAYDSVGANNGTLINGPLWTTGQVLGALSFDGVNDYVSVPDSPSFTVSNFSIVLWAKYVDNGQIMTELFHNYADEWFGLYGTTTGCNGNIRFQMDDGTPTWLCSESAYDEGSWVHIAAIRDCPNAYIYVNGKLESSMVLGSCGTIDGSNIEIGGWSGANQTVDGLVDDVRLYDRALSAEEVEQIYGYGLGPMFADRPGGDYHLKSERGRFWPEHNVWVLDEATSPCVDGGDPNVKPTDERMPNGGRINAGAYGNTPYASMSEWPIPEDNNRDGIVNWLDVAMLADKWLERLGWVE